MSGNPNTVDPDLEARVFAIDRLVPRLLTYYSLCCVPLLLFPPVAVVVWS